MAKMRKWRRELKLERKLPYTWKYQLEGQPEPWYANLAKTAEERKDKQLRDEITKLKPALAEKTLENDFLAAHHSDRSEPVGRTPNRLANSTIIFAPARRAEARRQARMAGPTNTGRFC